MSGWDLYPLGKTITEALERDARGGYWPPVLVSMEHLRGHCLWTQVKTRKTRECIRCRSQCHSGVTMFKPATNSHYRSDRLCTECIEKLIRFSGQEEKAT